jgi:hypothetical protein
MDVTLSKKLFDYKYMVAIDKLRLHCAKCLSFMKPSQFVMLACPASFFRKIPVKPE